MITSFYKDTRRSCRYCRSEGPPLVEPTGKKRLVTLICACCGNPLGSRYVPKKRRKNEKRL